MRTLLKITSITFAICALFALNSCEKDDPGMDGKKTIVGNVRYIDGNVEGATVYITFDATGATNTYDYTTTTDASGNYRFENLSKGDYFIDADYTDDLGFYFESAGAHIEIKNSKEKEKITVNLVLE